MRKSSILSAAVVAVASVASAQAPTQSAPITGVAYRVTYNKETSASRVILTEMSFDVSSPAPVVLSLPSWTPGEYEIHNFARNISSFAARQAEKDLAWEKADPDTWRVHPSGAGRITVSFEYTADTLDNGSSWSKRDFLLFNGTNLFLYPEGVSADFTSTVTLSTEPGWKVVTGMQRTAPLTYSSSSYHDLVDMPFFVGVFDVDSARISGKWVRFASYPSGSIAGPTRAQVWTQLKQVIPPQVSVFGEAPWRDYSVMQITDSTYPAGSGAGLEHQSSHVDIVSPALAGSSVMPSLYAHEIFHAWNVKRIRPFDMMPYRYDREQPTKLLWVSEGITDYYADLAEVRGKTVTPAEFYEMTRVKMREVAAAPPTSLEDASLSAWIKVRDGTEYLYYSKGSLAGMLIDIIVRDATDNRASLDNVMLTLYNDTYKRDRGFTDADWWTIVSKTAGGKSFDVFRRSYVEGREAMPYAAVFALAGLKVTADSVRAPRAGVQTIQDSEGVRVIEVAPGSSAGEAGVLTGDYLISLGDVSVADPGFGAVFRPKYSRSAEGAPITIKVKRDGTKLDLPAKLHFTTTVQASIVEDQAASPKARAIRAGLLTGTTRP
ncbi:MAG: M61 family metallopeptidase [Gemmatimonadaceae bacterium]|nr:M61 family metallopeptidase [Gemmatimonadaceae bacterium]MBA3644639.1 M61 family metallopeptidase [Gemmatimonadaceae bacterium]